MLFALDKHEDSERDMWLFVCSGMATKWANQNKLCNAVSMRAMFEVEVKMEERNIKLE